MAFAKQYRPAIEWAINAHCVPAHERDDVRQDVYLRILLRFRRHGPLGEGSHASFAIAVARNAVATHFRAKKHNRPTAEEPALAHWLADGQPLPDELLARSDGHERLHLAIASLPPLKRHVVRRVLAGATLAEVASELGREYIATKVLHHRAVQDLRKALKQ